MVVPTYESFRQLLSSLVDRPTEFSSQDVSDAIDHLATPGAALPAQVGAFLTALKLSGRDFTVPVLAAASEAMMRHAAPYTHPTSKGFIVDVVGTGGDGHNTFNVSTAAAIVAAGAGARIVKHGNAASTSKSGSADFLEALGCSLVSHPSEAAAGQSVAPANVPSSGNMPFQFLLASRYHPAMALIGPIRKSLPFRSLFNVIGPLINPARPDGMVVGVADPRLGHTFAETLRKTGVKRAMVVCGLEGLDEISIAGPTRTWSFTDDGAPILETLIDPSLFGLREHTLNAVASGSPSENAEIFLALISSRSPNSRLPCEEARAAAIEDFILLNASAVLRTAGVVEDWKDGVNMARESMRKGGALQALDQFRSANVLDG